MTSMVVAASCCVAFSLLVVLQICTYSMKLQGQRTSSIFFLLNLELTARWLKLEQKTVFQQDKMEMNPGLCQESNQFSLTPNILPESYQKLVDGNRKCVVFLQLAKVH
ncbi:hypothetical protein XENORESO_018640 [Xenotaenia resolanae]|uniref:Uncharacterized protein n=1 Tax=Xenotaenia resolanae TaxID=208358 RepID=A0ABV0W124_9TELE